MRVSQGHLVQASHHFQASTPIFPLPFTRQQAQVVVVAHADRSAEARIERDLELLPNPPPSGDEMTADSAPQGKKYKGRNATLLGSLV